MKNIVWLASYPKSGNTWFRMFLANYLSNASKPVLLDEIESTPIASYTVDFEEQIGLNPFELTPEEVDLYRPDLYRVLSEEAKKNDEIRYKKTHDAYTLNARGEPLFPDEVSIGVVYFVRNPLDVCVSYANHSASEVQKTIRFLLDEKASLAGKKTGQLRQILMSWKSHVKSWKDQSLIPAHFVRYEDMLQNSMKTFGSIIHFLGLEYDTRRLEQAILHCDFTIFQQMEEKEGFKERAQRCKQFFWKGKTGYFRDYLSKEQIDRIVEYNYDTMKEFGYINASGKLTV